MRIIIKGKPGEGKSSFAAKIAQFLDKEGCKVTIDDDDISRGDMTIEHAISNFDKIKLIGYIKVKTKQTRK